MKRNAMVRLLSLFGLLLTYSAAHPIGIVYTGVGGVGDLMEMTSVEAMVTIQDRVAVTRLDQVFTNLRDNQVEGIYEFNLPAGAIITDLVLWIGEKRVQGIIMEKEEARRTYDEIVGRNIDPALVEEIDEGFFRLSIFPFPARGSRRVELEYTQVLDGRDGIMRYRFPLAAESGRVTEVERFDLQIDLKSQMPFEVSVEESFERITIVEQEDDKSARVVFIDEEVRADRDFELVCRETGDLSLPRIISYAAPGDEMGYYALWLPPLEINESEPVPHSITFLVDVSGSMEEDRLPPTVRALSSAIQSLEEEDYFNVIAFSNIAFSFKADPVAANGINRAAGVEFVESLRAGGGTNFGEPLRMALGQTFPPDRVNFLILLTDGHAENSLEELNQLIDEQGGDGVRLFTVGVGSGVNRGYLNALATSNRGASRFVVTESDIETELVRMFSEFVRPIFLPTKLETVGLELVEVFPDNVDILGAGGELFQVGRYPRGGPFTLKFEGRVLGGQDSARLLSFEYPLELAVENTEQPLLPRLWAQQKVRHLEAGMADARYYSDWELLEIYPDEMRQILELGLNYRLVTRRTALFAPDDDIVVQQEAELEEDFGGTATAVEEELRTTRWLGKGFALRQGVWVDMAFVEGMPLLRYEPGPDQPEALVGFSQLDKEMIVVWRGTAYSFSGDARPQTPTLQQNHPNPFNSGTIIRFDVPQSEAIRLVVYNLNGQPVATLATGVHAAGSYTVHWDGRDDAGRQLASGTYLYRLHGKTLVQVRKLVMLR
jgi:Ca-activated chloride channel homolog